jgi:thymidylate synthase
MLAQQCNLIPHEVIVSIGDLHAYKNHTSQIQTQLQRETRALPSLHINCNPNSIYDYKFEDFEINNYNAHPSIKAPISI